MTLMGVPSVRRSATPRRWLRALCRTWTQACVIDRELLAMRVDLGRHAGCGSETDA